MRKHMKPNNKFLRTFLWAGGIEKARIEGGLPIGGQPIVT